MCLLLRFFIVSYLVQLCLSAAGIFDDYDLFASNLVQPDAGDDGSQLLSSVEAPLTNLDSYESNLDPLNGLDLGGLDSDFNIFTSDESVQDQAADVPYRDSMAGGENECSLDGLPASRIRARGGESCVTRKKQPTLDLKLPTLGSLPAKKKLPSPSPINGPAWAEITNPETCPMSFRESYYIPICGTRLGDVGLYTPTELNGLRGWTVTDATIFKLGFEVCFNPKQIWCCENYYQDIRMAYPCETVMEAWTWADRYVPQLDGGGYHGTGVPNEAH